MSPFKTPDGQAKYLAAYEATLKTWPVLPEVRDVPTRFGNTHVNVAGPQDAPPLFLVHGFGFSSTQWYPNIAALSREHRVYAPDVIDQYGRSSPTQVLRTREDYAAWYGDVMDGLGVPRADLAGHSYGGWLTLNFALAQPGRVNRLALLSPAASFVPMTKEFYIRGMAANLLLSDWAIYGMVQWMTTVGKVKGLPVVDQFATAMRTFKLQPLAFPSVFPEVELRGISFPVLLLVGEKEVIYAAKSTDVIQRARELAPAVAAEVVPGGGHAFTMDQPEWTNARILRFLA